MRALAALSLMLFAAACVAKSDVIHLKMMGGGWGIPPKEAMDPQSKALRAVFDEFHRTHPNTVIDNIGGLQISGPASESNFLLSMAGDNAPDVFYSNFRKLWDFYGQGFMYPLDEYVKQDPWVVKRLHPQVRNVITINGHVYCIPFFQVCMALFYRKDMFAAAGLDPKRPPRTWEEFVRYGRKLTRMNPRQYAFAFDTSPQGKGWLWCNFLWQSGGDVLKQDAQGNWLSALDTPEAARAVQFFRRLTTETWTGPDGKQWGPVAPCIPSPYDEVGRGRIAMWMIYSSELMLSWATVNPELVGIAPLPAGPAGMANEINAGCWAINSTIKDRRKRDAAWEFIKYMCSDESRRIQTKTMVDAGFAKFVTPEYLEKFGYSQYLRELDPEWVAANREVFKHGRPEPNGKHTEMVYIQLDEPLERAMHEPNTPARQLVHDCAVEMNRKMLNYVPPEVREARRRWAWSIFAAICVLAVGLVARAWKRRRLVVDDFAVSRVAGNKGGMAKATVWLLMLPALATVIVWAYYPLARGLVIAFQDYKIVLPTHWVGMDNFIDVFFSVTFWRGLVNSCLYTLLALGIGFFLPILLAIGLSEVPRGKMLFRTLYYLPAVTSGLVIVLIWRDFYQNADNGLMNVVTAPLFNGLNGIVHGINWLCHCKIGEFAATHDWLGDPRWALFSVVLPAVWAGAGPGSIIYLAAMKNIPEEFYEAADLDGAGIWQKIRHVTLPGLKPLILINLVGVFIGSFKAMENVFVMTGGGPLYATHVLGLEIWYNAFMYLRFGYATAAAWIMGSLLIGFTMLQIRNLLKMRFSATR